MAATQKIMHVVGARPNFMKTAPIMRAMQGRFEQVLVHTGQHYDDNMSQVFFEDLGLPQPDIYLGVGSASHAVQTARIMIALEEIMLAQRPDLVMVVGDVNSTLAASLVCAKLHIPVAHVEAGLRSFDREMPEEINRLVVDQIADLLLTPSRDGDAQLLKEGIPAERVQFVGNVMIDSLVHALERAKKSTVLDELGLAPGTFAVLTLHRPSNVDDPETLRGILEALTDIQQQIPIIFPIHPRTQGRIEAFGLQAMLDAAPDLRITEPLGYIDFLSLYSNAKLALTDSGGLQEETTYLGIPCVTLRFNTERPITVTEGTNVLVGSDPDAIRRVAFDVLAGRGKQGRIPEYWDGRTSERIAEACAAFFARQEARA
ncbi:MAG: UDP-N-acetylglucosamine 2-epimerase (non-hydrolyzing) [Anaerolineae bacterium]|nr:UDP-N-acetylglucosamine 2-epimerase (non-hydrolyzing) [Anaerolineae bacterium]